MVGYTVPTWYGYAGWGMLDYFFEQPGRFTLAEAFFANQQALTHRLATYFPGAEKARGMQDPALAVKPSPLAGKAGLSGNDVRGLLYDRDVIAFYGDPAWEARMAPGPLAWEQTLTEKDGAYTLEIRPLKGEKTFAPVSINGSQRGYRPIVQLLPHRLDARSMRVKEGADLAPVVTGNFILVPNPGKCDPQRSYRVVFEAKRAGKP
jgi:zinc protease